MYDRMTKSELQYMVDSLGLTVKGTGVNGAVLKVDLIRALEQYNDQPEIEEIEPEEVYKVMEPVPEMVKATVTPDLQPDPTVKVMVKVPWVEIKSGSSGYSRKFMEVDNPITVTKEEYDTNLARTGLFELIKK